MSNSILLFYICKKIKPPYDCTTLRFTEHPPTWHCRNHFFSTHPTTPCPVAFWQNWPKAITDCGEDDNIKTIILKSGGHRTFCAGASFNELISINDFPTGKKFFMGFANVINACRKCPKLIIGRVQGKAVGGGDRSGLGSGLLFGEQICGGETERTQCGHWPLRRRPSSTTENRPLRHESIGHQCQ